MTQPAIEVADIVRAKGSQFLERFQSSVSYQQLKAFRAVERCRTAALGGHKDKCVGCAYEPPISYNSCRSRCCPKCQAQARRRWLEAQQRDLLNTNYFHVVFTIPHALNPLALTTPKPFFDLLFEASSQTLLEVAAAPKRLGAEIGFLSILHTWSSNLLPHYHVHCVVPAGGLSADYQRWIPTSHLRFLLPIPILRTVFRTKFLDGLRELYRILVVTMALARNACLATQETPAVAANNETSPLIVGHPFSAIKYARSVRILPDSKQKFLHNERYPTRIARDADGRLLIQVIHSDNLLPDCDQLDLPIPPVCPV
jgi:hypothetical protein